MCLLRTFSLPCPVAACTLVHLVPWLKEPSHTLQHCPLCCKALQQPQLISSPAQHWMAQRFAAHFSMVHRAPHARNLYFKREEKTENMRYEWASAPKKPLKRGSQWGCQTQNESHLITKDPCNAIVSCSLPASSLIASCPGGTFCCGRQERQLTSTIALRPSWAKLLAFTLHRRPQQRKACTSKTLPHIKSGIDEYAGISSTTFTFWQCPFIFAASS